MNKNRFLGSTLNYMRTKAVKYFILRFFADDFVHKKNSYFFMSLKLFAENVWAAVSA